MPKVIILSSILKPCDEVRMYERIARSLAKEDDWQIHISGTQPSQSDRQLQGIFFHPLTPSDLPRRGRIRRIIKTYKLWKKLNPQVIICTAPELIPIGVYFKLFNDVKLVYDVQEDFRKNITFQRIYIGVKKQLVLLYVAILRKYLSRSVDYFFLAEETYLEDIGYPKDKCIVLANKTADIQIEEQSYNKNQLLFTGIISNYAGIQTAINLYQSLKSERHELRLTIAGYCYDPKLISWLGSLAKEEPDIQLVGIDHFLSHEIIVRQIRSSSLGIICHEYNEVSQDRIPTKLYEYVFYQLPYIIPANTHWEKKGKELGGAIPVDFNRIDFTKIHKTLDSRNPSAMKYRSENASWAQEEPKLIDAIQLLLK